MNLKLIAPCGMNCSICMAYLRENNKCCGCRYSNINKPITRIKCKIKNCKIIIDNNWKYCSEKCKKFPCKFLERLDKRYITKYGMSMIDNLNNIENNGIRKFIKSEENKWIKENKILCVHNKRFYKIPKF